jgi:hypothetical protein
MNTTRITFCVNTPLYIEVSYKEFRKMDDVSKLDDESAKAVWDVLVDKAGKEKTIMGDAMTGYDANECVAEALGEVENLVAESVEEALEQVNSE